MEKKNIQRNLLAKISSSYCLKIIYSYYSFLNLIKYNKTLQKKLDLTLYDYQISFLQNKICIDYDKIPFDQLIKFIQNEFNIDFLKAKNTLNLIKIINKIKANKAFAKLDILNIPKEKSKNILLTKEIGLTGNQNILELNISAPAAVNNQEKEQIRIPSGLFPNLRKLIVDTNCIIPASLLINLEYLLLGIIPYKDLLFVNDVNTEILDLDKLKYIQIKYKKICIRCKAFDSFIMEKKYGDLCCNNCGLVYDELDEDEYKGKKIYHDKKYNIKFNFKNLVRFIIEINITDNFSFISNYFCLDKIYDALNKKKFIIDRNKYIYDNLKEVFLNLAFNNSLKYFKFVVLTRKNIIKQKVLSFKMKKAKDGKKYFNIKLDGYKNKSYCKFYKEKYEEKNLKYFKNYDILNNYNVSMEKLNFLGMGYHENCDVEKINKLFELKDNNYSLQEIVLNFQNKKIDIDNLFKNITKFRVIQNIVIFDKIKNKNKFMNFIEDISKLDLLNVIKLCCFDRLSAKEKDIIKKLLPKATVQDYSVEQNFDDVKKNADYIIY